jgi:uncharacterized protein (DUF1499 family)
MLWSSMPRWEIIAGRDGVIWATRRTRVFKLVDDVLPAAAPAQAIPPRCSPAAHLGVGLYDLGQNRRNLGELWMALDRRAPRCRRH